MKDIQAWTEYCKAMTPAIVETCSRTAVNIGPTGLVKALAQALPEWKFRHALARGGWYRLGGIVDAAGERLSDHLESWAEAEIDARQGDVGALVDDYAGQTLYATRLVGQTYYLVASAGDEPDDFLQLEIEHLQEMRAHPLFANDPATIEELVDPRGSKEAPQPIGLPYYNFRRVQHIGSVVARMRAQKPEAQPVHRLLGDWQASSAGGTSAFSNHWLIATSEHLDRYQQTVFRAQAIATHNGPPPEFEAEPGTSGVALHKALSHFDREVGYPMAWYFHLLTTKAVPHWVAQTVTEDALGGFAYLPQRDIDVVRSWLHRPYAL